MAFQALEETFAFKTPFRAEEIFGGQLEEPILHSIWAVRSFLKELPTSGSSYFRYIRILN
jgi:hypothetical protein